MDKQNTNIKHDIIHRLKIAHGHLEKVMSMVEKDTYCIDIVHQSMAIQAAMKKVDEIILENHLKTCVANDIRQGRVNETVKEVMEVVKKK